MPLRAVLFDLFGTVVHFAPQVPVVEVAGTTWRSTMGWLRTAAERELPQVPFEALLPALMQVSEQIVRQRPPEYFEVPSRERFRRALQRLGVDHDNAGDTQAVAERLSLEHMGHLAATTCLPEGHREVLEKLAGRYRLGLVSNFDHGPTAHRILADHAIADFFEVTLISDGFGRRKPHAAIFETALRALGVAANETIFVGDSFSDDVVGAQNAQLESVWINTQGKPAPSDTPTPRFVIAHLDELPRLLDE